MPDDITEPEGVPGQDSPDLGDVFPDLPKPEPRPRARAAGNPAGEFRACADNWRLAAASTRERGHQIDAAVRSAVFTECADALEAWLAGLLPDVRLVAGWARGRAGKPREVTRAVERVLVMAADEKASDH